MALPFQQLNNNQLQILLQFDVNQYKIPVHVLSTMKYDPFATLDASDMNDPNNHLVRLFPNPRPESVYVYPGSNQFIGLHSQNFSLMSVNIRGMHTNFDVFEDTCRNHFNNIDVIGFCESKIDNGLSHLYQIPDYTSYHNCKRPGSGGVSLYARRNLLTTKLSELSIMVDHFQSIFMKIKHNNQYDVVGMVYRQPDTDPELFIHALQDTLDKISSLNCRFVYILGDWNLDILSHASNPRVQDLLSIMSEHMLYPTIDKPTRATATSATLIDNIFTNNTSLLNSLIVHSSITDHFPVISTFVSSSPTPRPPIKIQRRKIDETSLINLNNAIENIDWSDMYDSTDPNICLSQLMDSLTCLFNHHCPKQEIVIKNKHQNKQYITPGIKRSIKEKNRLQRLAAKWPITYGIRFKRYRNILNKTIKNSKAQYIQSQLENASNIKQYYKTLNKILKGTSNQNNITLKINGTDTCDPTTVANHLNDHFASVGAKLATQVPPSTTNFTQYMPPPSNCSLFLYPTTPLEIKAIVSKSKDSSPGCDEIPMSLFKNCINNLAHPLSVLTNLIFKTGIFPYAMKVAKVTAIYKSGCQNEPNNFRPISVLNSVCKIVESAISTRLVEYLESQHLLVDAQHGGRKCRSTDTALNQLLEFTYSALDSKQTIIMTFLDLKKAFDSLPHDILIQKLQFFGICGTPLKLFENYLIGRKQFVHNDHCNSALMDITYGVPQGSIIGPILFLSFINDLIYCAPALKHILYVDDTTLYTSSRNALEAYDTMNQQLVFIGEWTRANGLTLHTAKCCYMMLSRQQPPDVVPIISLNNQILEKVVSVKFLGIMIDHKIKWTLQTQQISNKVSKICGLIYRTRQYLTQKSLVTLYNSLIYPTLAYGIVHWGGAATSHITRVIKVQKRAIRAMFHLKTRDSTQTYFRDFNILNIQQMVIYFTAIFVHKCLFGQNCLSSNYTYMDHHHSTRNNHNHLISPRFNTSHAQQSVLYTGCKIWNSLPRDIRDSQSIFVLKRRLKTHLLTPS